MNWSSALLSLLPLLIPVVVWAVLNRRDSQQRASKLVNQAAVGGASVSTKAGDGPSVVAVAGGGRAPRFHVGEFSSGGAIGRTAKSTLVKDVLLGEHECVLFAYIEELHGRALPWGDVLDAGTGSHSLGWALALDSSSVTAVTGDEAMLRDVQRDFSGKLRAADELVIGNWKNDDFLEGRQYDVLLADYLLGALDGFAPYFQHKLLPRLKRHIRPGGWLFFVGTEPLPEKCETRPQQLISDVARTRDAAILLGADRKRIYREYPLDWVLEHLATAGFRVVGVGSFDVTYTSKTVLRQLAVAERKLPLMDAGLREGMRSHIEHLKEQVVTTNWRGVHLGADYVIGCKLA